jgi:hypothetical protein
LAPVGCEEISRHNFAGAQRVVGAGAIGSQSVRAVIGRSGRALRGANESSPFAGKATGIRSRLRTKQLQKLTPPPGDCVEHNVNSHRVQVELRMGHFLISLNQGQLVGAPVFVMQNRCHAKQMLR